ncbi:MAG: KpsF/GutQ family sugar-phosphate isomerase [Pelagibacteraceae bacterium TMED124]|nr:KpsF/GutQ family sugar-phosphate isomerase [Rickettsiales bacterium]RPG16520.1 MAG: KpsF/GutQ family sugar-phosphate isomerase [Pelagibacteraceae bacterium TMED124]|tara:strand:- start:3788 stop:4726 length:939 start_codon:yes stop_codon:yes gene_type:complete
MTFSIGQNVIDIEIRALNLLKKSLSKIQFQMAVNYLYKTSGKIIISGIGKSGHIGSKISSTLSSIGSSSFFLHPSEANHGDLGMVTKKDCMILISNSGESSELLNLILFCKKIKIPIISITSEGKSTLAKQSSAVLLIPKNVEACPLELAPTSSTTCTLVLGDALAITLLRKRKFTSKDFLKLHPGGKLGRLLLKVGDIMKTQKLIPLIQQDKNVSEAILEMTSKGQGCVGVLSKRHNSLIGIITDGDLRRFMAKNLLEKNVTEIMTKNPKTLSPDTLVNEALKLMNKQSITNYFITKNKKPIGIIHLHDIL